MQTFFKYCPDIDEILCKYYENIVLILNIDKLRYKLSKTDNWNDKDFWELGRGGIHFNFGIWSDVQTRDVPEVEYYEITNNTNKEVPVYKKKEQPVRFLMISSETARWIISEDVAGQDVKLEKNETKETPDKNLGSWQKKGYQWAKNNRDRMQSEWIKQKNKSNKNNNQNNNNQNNHINNENINNKNNHINNKNNNNNNNNQNHNNQNHNNNNNNFSWVVTQLKLT